MPPLRDFQTRFMAALEDASPAAPAQASAMAAPGTPGTPGTAVTPGTPLAGLRVYQNNYRGNFVDALRGTFPAIRRLVGENYFRRTVGEFQRRHPSRSGDLAQAGREFPRHLAELHGADEFRYLADVARLEWAIHESLGAAEHPPMDLSRLARVAPAAYESLRFLPHPTLRLFASPYPALRIWHGNVDPGAPGSDAIELPDGGNEVAVLRPRLRLRCLSLGRGEYAFLESLISGGCFAAAIARAEAIEPEFDATAALQRWVAAEGLVDFRVEET